MKTVFIFGSDTLKRIFNVIGKADKRPSNAPVAPARAGARGSALRRLAALLIAAAFCFGLCACGKAESEGQTDGGKPVIVATIFPYYDFAKNICGDAFDVVLLVPPGADSHSYEPTPKDVKLVRDCDLFLYTGGDEDGAFQQLLDSAGPRVNSLMLSPYVESLKEELVEGMEGEADGGYDPHIWTSPANAMAICFAIRTAVKEIVPDLDNTLYGDYDLRLLELERDFADYFAEHKEPLIFGDRFPFRYLTYEYGVKYYAAFPGCADYTEPSAKTIKTLIEKAKEYGVKTVYYAEGADTAAAESIAAEIGGKTALLHSCHRVTQAEIDAGKGYLDFMRENLETLKNSD